MTRTFIPKSEIPYYTKLLSWMFSCTGPIEKIVLYSLQNNNAIKYVKEENPDIEDSNILIVNKDILKRDELETLRSESSIDFSSYVYPRYKDIIMLLDREVPDIVFADMNKYISTFDKTNLLLNKDSIKKGLFYTVILSSKENYENEDQIIEEKLQNTKFKNIIKTNTERLLYLNENKLILRVMDNRFKNIISHLKVNSEDVKRIIDLIIKNFDTFNDLNDICYLIADDMIRENDPKKFLLISALTSFIEGKPVSSFTKNSVGKVELISIINATRSSFLALVNLIDNNSWALEAIPSKPLAYLYKYGFVNVIETMCFGVFLEESLIVKEAISYDEIRDIQEIHEISEEALEIIEELNEIHRVQEGTATTECKTPEQDIQNSVPLNKETENTFVLDRKLYNIDELTRLSLLPNVNKLTLSEFTTVISESIDADADPAEALKFVAYKKIKNSKEF